VPAEANRTGMPDNDITTVHFAITATTRVAVMAGRPRGAPPTVIPVNAWMRQSIGCRGDPYGRPAPDNPDNLYSLWSCVFQKPLLANMDDQN